MPVAVAPQKKSKEVACRRDEVELSEILLPAPKPHQDLRQWPLISSPEPSLVSQTFFAATIPVILVEYLPVNLHMIFQHRPYYKGSRYGFFTCFAAQTEFSFYFTLALFGAHSH